MPKGVREGLYEKFQGLGVNLGCASVAIGVASRLLGAQAFLLGSAPFKLGSLDQVRAFRAPRVQASGFGFRASGLKGLGFRV